MSLDFEIIDEEEFNKSTASVAPVAVASSTVARGDAPDAVETFPCDYCGHCERPNQCQWSIQCPKCNAPAGKIGWDTMCRTPTGGVTGIHQERYDKAVRS